ncbi:MAG TPA: CinA family protein [Thermoplasmatales archaeon]|nr:CinA family protein [Thermoplasmatales archaeon]
MVVMNTDLLHKVSSILKAKNLTIATAESCTGGLLGHILTNVSGSSTYFDRGIISYSNRAKMELLGVAADVIEKHGAVSEETARAMAEGVRERSNVDIGIATTGIAGPTGGTREKPVGLVYIALADGKQTIVKKFLFKGDRLANKENACEAALSMLHELLEKME